MLANKYHLDVIKIYERHTLPQYKYKKVCKVCNNKRFTNIDKNNRLVVCHRCVNTIKAKKEWLEFAENTKGIGVW